MSLETGKWVWVLILAIAAPLAACRQDEKETIREKTVQVPVPVPVPGGSSVALLQGKGLTRFHADLTSTTDDAACLTCHGDMSDEKKGGTVNGVAKPAFHPRHLKIYATSSFKCTNCHSPVDLLEGSGGNLRRQVDVEICAACHKPGGVAAASGYQLYQQ